MLLLYSHIDENFIKIYQNQLNTALKESDRDDSNVHKTNFDTMPLHVRIENKTADIELVIEHLHPILHPLSGLPTQIQRL